jgi:hypothetical protein
MPAADLVPRPYDVLASNPEREAVAEALRDHAGNGRLDPEELEQRLERAYVARRRADLLPLLADLPGDERPAPRRRRPQVGQLSPMLVLAVALIAIWALTGAGYFWPIWPIGAIALSSFKHRRGGCAARRSPARVLPDA